MVPPYTSSPTCLCTGRDSPVRDDSFRVLSPSFTIPSQGTFSPLLTDTVAPTATNDAGTWTKSCVIGFTKRARSGLSFTMAPSAVRARMVARASRYSDARKTKVTAAASMNSWIATAPSMANNTKQLVSKLKRIMLPRAFLAIAGNPSTTLNNAVYLRYDQFPPRIDRMDRIQKNPDRATAGRTAPFSSSSSSCSCSFPRTTTGNAHFPSAAPSCTIVVARPSSIIMLSQSLLADT
mmetsp:Transcript_10528/g.16067  ORF Transcript_10528/g.16067 Transcript_10528/m.16067 type:complete len:236 (-) Transcript_10528:533-1240(-)